jgi:hypothetical protein
VYSGKSMGQRDAYNTKPNRDFIVLDGVVKMNGLHYTFFSFRRITLYIYHLYKQKNKKTITYTTKAILKMTGEGEGITFYGLVTLLRLFAILSRGTRGSIVDVLEDLIDRQLTLGDFSRLGGMLLGLLRLLLLLLLFQFTSTLGL